MTAFVAIMIFFLAMFIAQSGLSHSPTVTLPRALHPAPLPRAIREDAITITVRRDGAILFRSDRVLSSSLSRLISESLREGSDRKVYINADAKARYGEVLAVLGYVRDAGVQDIAFFAYQRTP
jgi:biopolymer transport protein TolR